MATNDVLTEERRLEQVYDQLAGAVWDGVHEGRSWDAIKPRIQEVLTEAAKTCRRLYLARRAAGDPVYEAHAVLSGPLIDLSANGAGSPNGDKDAPAGRLPAQDRCRSCQAPMSWLRGPNGKPIPLDPDPVPNGNIAVRGTTVDYVKPDPAADGPRYVSHFVTCPESASWKGKKRGGG